MKSYRGWPAERRANRRTPVTAWSGMLLVPGHEPVQRFRICDALAKLVSNIDARYDLFDCDFDPKQAREILSAIEKGK